MLNDDVEHWFLNMYYNIKSLSAFEYQITAVDFNSYFDIYPIPFDKFAIISIIKGIEGKSQKYKNEQEDLKKQSKEKQAVKK